MKTKHIIISLLIICTICLYVSLSFAPSKKAALKIGSKAPSFALYNLKMKLMKLSKFVKLKTTTRNPKNYYVILSFWATYCKPCKEEMPELMAIAEKYKEKDLKIFCVSIDKEGADIVKPYIEENNFNLPVLLDVYKVTADKYGVTKLPSLFLMDKNGKIRLKFVGFKETNIANLKAKLKSIFGF